jgi:hypothetical protein
VDAIAIVGPDVYAGGSFTNMGGNPAADHIARWGTIYYYSYLPLTKKP